MTRGMISETIKPSSGNYSRLLANGGFEAFLWTQFLGAFNDNVYKMMVSILAIDVASNAQLGARYLALAGAVFVLPFLLFAGYAGQLADRYSKTSVLKITKALEIVTMVLGLSALLLNRIEILLGVLFLLAVQANFFSPAKYGILPEMMSEAEISAANGLVEFSTLAAIVLGTSFGSFLIERWKLNPWRLGSTLLAIAVVGTLCSLKIPKVSPSGSMERFHWNPFSEVWLGFRRLRGNRALALTVSGLSYFWFIGALFQMAVLLAGTETLHINGSKAGLLATALAIGIGIGSIAAGWLSHDHIELGLVPIGSSLLGVFSIFLALTHSYAGALCWLIAIGFSGGLFFVPLNAFLQERAGTQEKGRLLATNNFVNMAGILLASAILWILHDQLHWPAIRIIAALGIVTLAATAYIVSVLPAELLRLNVFGLSRLLFRITIEGAERIPATGAAILVSNHVSYVDAVLIGGCTHRFIRFLMWKPYFDLKFAKPFFKILQAIPINPGSPKETVRALRNASNELKQGELVCIFPEGGLTRTGHVQTFQRGIEHLMGYAPDVPVLPIYLDGLRNHPLSATGRRSFLDWIRSLRREIRIVIANPIYGTITAHDLRLRVLELGTRAVNLRKKSDSTLAHALIRSARRNWFRPAIADSTKKQLNFGATLTAAVLVRNWLNANRAAEKHIAMLLPASVGAAIANFGVTLGGRTSINLNFTSGEQNCRSAMEQCGVRTVITSKAFLSKANLPAWPEMVYLEELMPQFGRAQKAVAMLTARFARTKRLAGRIAPDHLATVLFSSGSTGVPKGIELTHWNVLSNIEAAASVFPLNSDDCMLGVLPFFHSFGYTFALWFPVARQFRAVYHPNPTDAKAVGELACTHHATFFLSTPTFCTHYIRKCAPEQFSTLRYILVGAEKLRDSVANEFRNKFGVGVLAGYGATELGPCVSANTPEPSDSDGQPGTRSGSVGRPLPGVSLRIVHPETLAPLPCGQQGLLLVNSPSRMAGYFGSSEKSAQVLHEGYYVTGDLAYIDEDGFLFITDRLSRFSKIAGEMIPHLRIEETASAALENSPCFVTGVPDERRGERLVMLYTSPHTTPAQIIEHLNAAGLPALWIPKRESIFLVESIPVLGSGKIDLFRARALANERASAEPASMEVTA